MLLGRLERNPLLQYAAQQWGTHARGKVESALQDRILAFFQSGRALASAQQALFATSSLYRRAAVTSKTPLPLHVAIYFGLEATCKRLVDCTSQADMEQQDYDGRTALDWAIIRGEHGIETMLRERGVSSQRSEGSLMTNASLRKDFIADS